MQQETAAQLWTKYRDTSVVSRAEHFAKFTLPYLMVDPLSGHGRATVEHDFQSSGSMLVNNLASKISQALFPPGVPYFKMEVSPALQAAADEAGLDEATLAGRMATLEQEATGQVFLHGGQHKLTHLIKLLIVTGNGMLYRDPERRRFMVWSLHSYGVRRTPTGEVADAVLKQRFRWDDLPVEYQTRLAASRPGQYKDSSELELYTRIKTERGVPNNRVVVTQEIAGVEVAEPTEYPEHLSPYMFPTWNLADGEHYGRGLVEDYSGDFARLSLVTEQLGLYELESLSMLNLVDEAAGGIVDDYHDADTGDFVRGKATAITAYERGDYNKIIAISNSINTVTQRLGQAFMYTGSMRQAERVTATEVRVIAREAESTLGGVYSTLSEALQAPLAFLSVAEVTSDNDGLLMGLIQREIRPSIVTGIPAMTRAVETENLIIASQEAAAIIPPLVQISRRIDGDKLLERIFQGNSVDLSAVSKTPEQVQQEIQAEQAALQAQQQAAQAALTGDADQVQNALQGL